MVEAIILAGGRGTRLASVVSHVPKPLAPVAGRAFLDFVLDGLAASGLVTRVVLAVGHLSAEVEAHYAAAAPPIPVDIVVEKEPLGTGGAVLAALRHIAGREVLVANGDSIVGADLAALLQHHQRSGAFATISLVAVPDVSRYGSVTLEGTRVVGFAEKTAAAGAGLINAGLYLFETAALGRFPVGPCSLERDVLPVLTATGGVQGVVTRGAFLDIGLPETYAEAPRFLSDFHSKARTGHE